MSKSNHDTCPVCGAALANCETIWAAEGTLYCSVSCGVHAIKAAVEGNEEEYFNEIAEERNPSDIGLCNDTEDTAVCNWRGTPANAHDLVNTDLGLLCDTCIEAIRSRGEQITTIGGAR